MRNSKQQNILELYWKDKRTEVEKVALPFQTVETVNAPKERGLYAEQLSVYKSLYTLIYIFNEVSLSHRTGQLSYKMGQAE